MAKKMKSNLLGAWAFLIGVVLALVFAFLQSYAGMWLVYVLFAVGLIVGLLNITDTEANQFLLASVALVIVSSFGSLVLTAISFVSAMLDNLLTIFVPAAVIVALKSVFNVAKR